MLRKIRLKNFVYFDDETIEIDNDHGPVFFTGETNSGKSCVFEAVRRCMSTSKSFGISNPHVQDKVMSVTCHFRGKQEIDVFSSVIRPACNQATEQCDEHVIKVVYIKRGDKDDSKFAVDLVKENRKHEMVCRSMSLKATSELKAVYEQCYMDLDRDFQNQLSKYDHEIKEFVNHENKGEYKETECERILKEYVDQTTVITFPIRSTSPYQWTASKRLDPSKTVDNSNVAEKADIVFWYLKNKCFTDEEKAKEKRYFSILSGNCNYDFQLDRDEKRVTIIDANLKGSEEKKPVSILKAPEGIYEAKKLSIILSLDRFKTVCLDNPDRGMHTQMVENLRDVILKGIQDKIIVVASQQPSFIYPWTIPRTFLFRLHKHQNEQTFRIVPMSRILKDEFQGRERTVQAISSNNFPTALLSRIVIFVEGDNDMRFLKELKQILLTRDIVEEYAQRCDATKDEFMEALYLLHIVPMIGEANKLRFHRVFSDLQIPHLFLLDYDSLFSNIPKQDDSAYKIYPFLRAFGLDCSDEVCKRAEGDISTLENSGIFVWQKTLNNPGTLESFIAAFCQEENLTDFMRECNVKLAKGNGSRLRKAPKLFNDKNVSSESITDIIARLLRVSLSSQSSNNEIVRLVKFLYTACKQEISSTPTTQNKNELSRNAYTKSFCFREWENEYF